MLEFIEYFYNINSILVIVGIYLLYKLGTIKHDLHLKLGRKGPPPLPFLGNMVDLFILGNHEFDRKCLRKYGKIYPLYFGGIKMCTVADEEILKQIMVKEFKCFSNRLDFGVNTKRVEKMLTSLKGKEWERVRSLITPTFTSGKLRKMSTMFSDATQLLKDRIMKHPDNQIIEFKQFYGALTMDAIARTMFGMEIDSQSNPNNPFIHHGQAMNKVSFFGPFIMILIVFPELKHVLKKFFFGWEFLGRDAVSFFHDVVEKAIAQREKSPEEYHDFLGLMMKARKNENDDEKDKSLNSKTLSNQEVLAQCIIFLLAGFETTAATLTFATYFLAKNPEAQEEVYEEIINKIGKEGEITYESLMEMPILDAAINETLRLCPPAARTERMCVQDVTLVTSDGEKLYAKKDDVFSIPIYAIHTDPSRWSDPDKFDLHRFDNDTKINPYSFMPFGMGPRSCVGMRFALLEAKWAIVTVLQNFEIKTCEETSDTLKFKRTILTNPEKPILLKVQRRK